MATLFESKRLVFRALEHTDADFICNLWRDSAIQVASASELPVPPGQQLAHNHIQHYMNCLLSAVICIPRSKSSSSSSTSPDAIGLVVLGVKSSSSNGRPQHSAKLCIAVSKDYRNKGYGTETVTWALDWAFRHAGLHKVAAEVYGFNHASKGMFEKMGFRLDGKLRDEVFSECKYWDILQFSMLSNEWRDKYRIER